MKPRILIVDARDSPQLRESDPTYPGYQDYDTFVVPLRPAISGLRGVRLVYANIGNPEDNAVDLYWLLRVGELGIQCRGANGSDGATFVIPVNSAQGFRTLHRGESDFSHIILQQPASDIHQLSVSLRLPGGGRPLIREPWFFVLELEYAP